MSIIAGIREKLNSNKADKDLLCREIDEYILSVDNLFLDKRLFVEKYDDYLKMNPPVTLRGDRVKSYGEMDIANYLFENGISYEYEKEYEFDTRTEDRAQDYQEGMKWKRNLHKEMHTALIECYSYERYNGELLSTLEKKLKGYGVKSKPISTEEMWSRISTGNTANFLTGVATLIGTVINLMNIRISQNPDIIF